MPTMYKNKTYTDLNNYLKQQSPTMQQAQNYKNVYQPPPKPTQQNTYYNPNADPVYKSIEQQNKALGKAAANDALASMSALTWGMPSSNARQSALQASQVYAGRTLDYIPQLAQYYRQNQEADREFNLKQAVTQANMTGYFNPYANTQIDPSLGQYSNDYQAEINRRRSINPNDPIIQQLEAARAQKIFSSPDLLQQYGEPYKTQEQRNADLARQIQQYNLQQMQDPNSPANQRSSLELQMLQNEAAFAPRLNQAKLDNIYADTASTNALRDQRQGNASGVNEKQQQDLDYAADLDFIKSNPKLALDEIRNNKEELIKYYGLNKYQQLEKAAKQAKDGYDKNNLQDRMKRVGNLTDIERQANLRMLEQ